MILAEIYLNGELKGNIDLDEDDLSLFKEWSDYNKLNPNKIQDLSNWQALKGGETV